MPAFRELFQRSIKEIFPSCNITRSEFNWPEPIFDVFKQDVYEIQKYVCDPDIKEGVSSTLPALYVDSDSSESNLYGVCINLYDLIQNN